MTATPDPRPTETRVGGGESHKTYLISTVLVITVALALAGVMVLLDMAGLDLEILGSFVLALAVGGRIVQMLGRLGGVAAASLTRWCYIATALGALCFEPWSLRIWVAAVALSVMAVFDYIEYRVKRRPAM